MTYEWGVNDDGSDCEGSFTTQVPASSLLHLAAEPSFISPSNITSDYLTFKEKHGVILI